MNSGDPGSGLHRVFFAVVRDTIRMIAFWLAITLPFAQLALLVSGLDTAGKTGTLLVLLCANGVALVLGHGHTPSFASRPPDTNRKQREGDTPVRTPYRSLLDR